MIRQRVRIRFSKDGDLRLISHRDLARVFERMFRRAALQLSMSEGFHPKPRVMFPSALGLGIVGKNEVMEFELAEELSAGEVRERISQEAPPGLTIRELRILEQGESKGRVECFGYEFPVPTDRRESVCRAIDDLLAKETCLIEREGKKQPVDVRAGLDDLECLDDRVRFRLWANCETTVRPREVLQVLGISDLEAGGLHLTRTEVELSP